MYSIKLDICKDNAHNLFVFDPVDINLSLDPNV